MVDGLVMLTIFGIIFLILGWHARSEQKKAFLEKDEGMNT